MRGPVARRLTVTLGAGVAIAVGTLLLLPAPLLHRITLVAPLLVVPALLRSHPVGTPSRRLGGGTALAAAIPLPVAFALPSGPIAVALALPWLVLCLLAATTAAIHGVHRLPGLLHPRRAAELGALVALGYLAVGALFLVFDRAGVRPLGFPSAIITLTATHFHFAGFGLLSVAAALALARPRLRLAVLGLASGIPLTAAGFVLPSDALGALGAVFVGMSGIAVAAVLLATASAGARVGALALLLGLPLGIAWAVAVWLHLPFLDLDAMVRTHGVLNAAGVVLVVLASGVGHDGEDHVAGTPRDRR